MTRHPRGRPSPLILALALLFWGVPEPCFALDRILDVSVERARELGITARLQPRAEDVRVQVEYRPTEPAKEFKRADLDVTHGGKRLIHAALMPRRPGPDTMLFDFYTAPEALPNATVTIVVWQTPRTGIGYRLNVKELLDREASGARKAGPSS